MAEVNGDESGCDLFRTPQLPQGALMLTLSLFLSRFPTLFFGDNDDCYRRGSFDDVDGREEMLDGAKMHKKQKRMN